MCCHIFALVVPPIILLTNTCECVLCRKQVWLVVDVEDHLTSWKNSKHSTMTRTGTRAISCPLVVFVRQHHLMLWSRRISLNRPAITPVQRGPLGTMLLIDQRRNLATWGCTWHVCRKALLLGVHLVIENVPVNSQRSTKQYKSYETMVCQVV